jgi:cysteine desulfurase
MTERAYLDWNATAPLAPPAREAILAALDVLGNPSSVHAEGRTARHLVELARSKVAALVGAEARNVTFTSGGTEANGLALTPAIETAGEKGPRDRLLVSGIEHPSVRSGHHFPSGDVEEIAVTKDGVVDLVALEGRLAELKSAGRCRPLVSIMHANNETGVVQPIAQAAAIVHQAGGLLHVDAVQAAGRIECNINDLCADLLTLSGHKLGAAKGVGALVRRSEDLHIGHPLIRGGGQERGVRAGTENVLGIMGFGAAADYGKLLIGASGGIAALRDELEQRLLDISPDATIFGIDANRLYNTSLFSVPGIKAETALIALDLEGIAVSSGAACSSGKVAASHVLAAMGVPPSLASGAIRVSLGATSGAHDIELFLKAWRKLVMGLSKGKRGLAA